MEFRRLCVKKPRRLEMFRPKHFTFIVSLIERPLTNNFIARNSGCLLQHRLDRPRAFRSLPTQRHILVHICCIRKAFKMSFFFYMTSDLSKVHHDQRNNIHWKGLPLCMCNLFCFHPWKCKQCFTRHLRCDTLPLVYMLWASMPVPVCSENIELFLRDVANLVAHKPVEYGWFITVNQQIIPIQRTVFSWSLGCWMSLIHEVSLICAGRFGIGVQDLPFGHPSTNALHILGKLLTSNFSRVAIKVWFSRDVWVICSDSTCRWVEGTEQVCFRNPNSFYGHSSHCPLLEKHLYELRVCTAPLWNADDGDRHYICAVKPPSIVNSNRGVAYTDPVTGTKYRLIVV